MLAAARTLATSALLTVAIAATAGAAAKVDQEGSRWTLANESLQRVVQTEPSLHTISLTNKLTAQPHQHTLQSQGFRLVLDDGKLTLEAAECLGACEHGPCMLAGDELHQQLDKKKADDFLESLE